MDLREAWCSQQIDVVSGSLAVCHYIPWQLPLAHPRTRATPKDSTFLSSLLEIEILMKKITSNSFSKWLSKYSHFLIAKIDNDK